MSLPPASQFLRTARPAWLPWSLLLATGLAFGLRVPRLAWQPLWWDEGYSIYFATEPLGRMLWLTAHDIHPPLYYALLHGWSLLFGPGPAAARVLSLALGTLAVPVAAWLALALWPGQVRVALIAAVLLAISPMHIYYSQEVRMYALAMLLGMLATGAFWKAVTRLEQGVPARRWLVAYVAAAALGLYTLYYLALLLVAQALWALWVYRNRWSVLRALFVAWAATLLLYLPWLAYALPKLVGYVAQKVEADQDQALGALDYAVRHLRAFVLGHQAGGDGLSAAGALLAAALLVMALWAWRRDRVATRPSPVPFLLTLFLFPFAAGFLLNLRLPFFPEGGERLLLFLLPPFLLLTAYGLDAARPRALLWAGAAALAACAALGIAAFFRTPRYTEHDYRPVIAQSVQQGRAGDTFLAIFPWMVGYWRAYTPAGIDGPTPLLLGDFAVEYGPDVETAIDDALARGSVWFPMPLSFGSDLPPQIETYLGAQAANLENRWLSDATRLTAWADLPAPVGGLPATADFGVARLVGGVASNAPGASTPADNSPLHLTLSWEFAPAAAPLRATIRLLDDQGRVWAQRDYTPDGSTGPDGDHLGLIIPPGTPPGAYHAAVGIGLGDSDALLPAPEASLAGGTLVDLGAVTIDAPAAPPDLARYAMAPLRAPVPQDGLTLLGARTPSDHLAGTELAVNLYAQADTAPPAPRMLSVRLLDASGAAVAGWEGWPLPAHPAPDWQPGLVYRLPVAFFTPATLPANDYTIDAAWVDPATGGRADPAGLGALRVERRSASMDPATAALPNPVEPPAQFGTHALLLGSEIRPGAPLTVTLGWQVLATLLPPHHVFVHAVDAAGTVVAQSDGPPASGGVRAPTGTWLPGEYLRTDHTLAIPPGVSVAELRVGLYDPQTGVRLPVTVAGAPAGDYATLAVPE